MINFKVTSRNHIKELREQLRPRAGRVINQFARDVLAVSQELVPVDTGDLKRSGQIIDYVDTKGDGRQRGVAKSISYSMPYAIYVHDGTSFMEGTPFLLTAFEALRPRLVEELNEIFKTSLGVI